MFSQSRCKALTLLTIVALSIANSPAWGIVIFDNFGANNAFDAGNGALVIDDAPGIREIGASFVTPASSYPLQLDSIELPLSWDAASASTNSTFDVRVHNNQAPGVPDFLPITGPQTTVSGVTPTPAIKTATYSGVVLQPSTQYWIVVTGNVNRGVWHYNTLGQSGQAVRQGNANAVWGYGDGTNAPTPAFRINATLAPPECYLTNDSFEDSEFTAGGPPTALNDWAGDASTITGAALGITPHSGSRMLQFDGAAPSGGSPTSVGSEVWQLLDLSHLATEIAAGKVFAEFEYFANRVADSPDGAAVDTEFSARIQANAGSPAAFPANVNNYLGLSTSQLLSDSDEQTWQRLDAAMQVPAGATFLAVRVAAVENLVNDSVNEFAGHFADSACVRITIVPEPGSGLLLGLTMSASLINARRRRPSY